MLRYVKDEFLDVEITQKTSYSKISDQQSGRLKIFKFEG